MRSAHRERLAAVEVELELPQRRERPERSPEDACAISVPKMYNVQKLRRAFRIGTKQMCFKIQITYIGFRAVQKSQSCLSRREENQMVRHYKFNIRVTQLQY